MVAHVSMTGGPSTPRWQPDRAMIPRGFAAEVQFSRRPLLSIPGCRGSCWVKGWVLCSRENMTPTVPWSYFCVKHLVLGLEWQTIASLPPAPSQHIKDSCCSLRLTFPSICPSHSQTCLWIISCCLCCIYSVYLCFPVLFCYIRHAFHTSKFLGHKFPRSFHTAQSGVVLWGHPVLSRAK